MNEQLKKAQGSATKRKPGRPAKVKDMIVEDGAIDPNVKIAPGELVVVKTQEEILHARITNLENCLAKMAHFSGSERVLDEFDIERWTVTKESMQKFKG